MYHKSACVLFVFPLAWGPFPGPCLLFQCPHVLTNNTTAARPRKKTVFFTRAPSPFWATWKIAQHLVAERTRNKIKIFTGENAKAQLLKEGVEERFIPDCLGGPASTAHLAKGGRLEKGVIAKYRY